MSRPAKVAGGILGSGFYLISQANNPQRYEVKLMGSGNPESADVVRARDSNVFVADKRSDKSKRQLNERSALWVELCGSDALTQFSRVLSAMGMPHKPLRGNLQTALDNVLSRLFPDS